MTAKIKLGKKGEKDALNFIIKLGLEPILQNYTVPNIGEIDIIARDYLCLCFIEVKTRSANNSDRPAKAVNIEKQNKIKKSAKVYLNRQKLENFTYRYDIIEVIYDNNKCKSITYLKEAY